MSIKRCLHPVLLDVFNGLGKYDIHVSYSLTESSINLRERFRVLDMNNMMVRLVLSFSLSTILILAVSSGRYLYIP